VQASPAFGQADLTNCERELIHLAGSVQPFGVLLTLQGPQFTIVQASTNTVALLGPAATSLLGRPLDTLGGDAVARLNALCANADLLEPVPLKCSLAAHGRPGEFEGTVHRVASDLLVLELEPLADPDVEAVGYDSPQLLDHLGSCIHRFSAASNINALADTVVKRFRDLVGYDRVMVYRFDPDGHGEIFAEAKKPALEPLLGHHYPATDIPQRARELYLRMRVRVLADVHYTPSPLVPPLRPDSSEPLDMSMCHLRSMSPLHLQYLKNMGVTGTLVASRSCVKGGCGA
jgi:chemotaxis family two-component system sensor kinase Cph1